MKQLIIYTFLYQAITPTDPELDEPRIVPFLDAVCRTHHGQTCRIKSRALGQIRVEFEDGQELDVHAGEIRPVKTA